RTFEETGKATGFVNIPLGKLYEGTYSVTVKAQSGNFSDGVKEEFKVVESVLKANKVKHYKLTDDIKFDESEHITILNFSNNDSSGYYGVLSSLANSWGERIDQKLSRMLASKLLERY